MEYKAKTAADVGDAGDGVEQLSLGFRDRPGHGSKFVLSLLAGCFFWLPLINHLLIWSHPLIQRAAIFSRELLVNRSSRRLARLSAHDRGTEQ